MGHVVVVKNKRVGQLHIAGMAAVVAAIVWLMVAAMSARAVSTALYVSPTGLDTNSGTSAAEPFKTVQRALDVATPGTTINLAEGNYTELLITKTAGTAAEPITIQGPETGKDITGRFKAVVTSPGAHAIDINHSYYTLKGFTVEGQKNIAHTEYPATPAEARSFKDEVQGRAVNSKAVYIGASSDSRDITGVRIDDMYIHGSGGECVRLRNNAFNNTISNSTIEWCGMYGGGNDVDQYKYHNAEGVYVGTSRKSTSQPMYENDSSSGNVISNTTIRTFGSECFNVKENAHSNVMTGSVCMYNDEPSASFAGSNIEFRGHNNRVENTIIEGSRGYNVKLRSDTADDDLGGNSVKNSSFKDWTGSAINSTQNSATMGEFCGNTFSGTAPILTGNSVGDPTAACTVAPPADIQAPVVSITAPAAGASVSGTVTIKATASDNVGVSKVEFLVNNTLIGTATAAPYEQAWTVPATAGTYTITARAYDAAGNSGTAQISVTRQPSAAVISFEAESGTMTSPMAIYNDTNAQGGKYITQAGGTGSGRATYRITVPVSGSYTLKGRVIAQTTSNNSFYYAFDTASKKDWQLPAPTTSWTWANGPTVTLTAGQHTLTIYRNENNARLDALTLTQNVTTSATTTTTATKR
ncbi:DUF1565 domain-containing protein [Candidatus Saccharibacteria bacterium]|nr:DUF1565 domain-containing protein [Candidatus Saccharibacteria bacterium]